MSDYTYEFENRSNCLEHYEWDNVWWDSADVTGIPRVMYIGDSISCGARKIATQVSGESLLFDGFGTSKSIDNPHFFPSVRLFAAQQRDRCAILFNNGLHGWHLEDEVEYGKHYEAFLKDLLCEFERTPIFLLLSTAVADTERNARVIVRNKAVLSLAEKYSLPVIDLYSLVDNHREFLSPDGVHLTPEGYKVLASTLVDAVKNIEVTS